MPTVIQSNYQNNLTKKYILTIPQIVTPHIHQITALAFDEFPSSSGFAFIKATLLSILFFIEARTTNPIIMKPIVIQSNRSNFTPLYIIEFCSNLL